METFCAYSADYFAWTEGKAVVARVRLLKFANASRQGYFPLYDMELLEVYAGDASVGDRVSLLGQDGGNCNGTIRDHRIGEEYIVFFPNTPDRHMTYYNDSDVDNPYPIFDLPGCGPSVLKVVNSQIRGTIAEEVNSVPLSGFSRQLTHCLGDYVKDDGEAHIPVPAIRVAVLPNPAREGFTVRPERAIAVHRITLYDVLGRLVWREDLGGEIVSEYRGSVAGLASGMYVIVLETDGLRIKEQVIVQ
ncbi:T9SS type A sorting domain-containing protein [Lewinella sp. IMCC34183]|uniref:T9SS type A sorting domain-containing protein n=1 Tax=Lewinella sp. IMCC34183 TaxID=2248762 RepID=UPI000E24694B|nr:T9SS type A sorting domain-containing protein [Lewinella sp. IMCC34183]